VVKKDGRREPFDRQKVVSSMAVACRKRRVPTAVLNTAAEEIERAVAELPESEISSTDIGDLVLEKLSEIDNVAYVRFASVYREFEDAGEFRDFVAAFQRRKKTAATRR
jgi:transcriptional repressor NrdR